MKIMSLHELNNGITVCFNVSCVSLYLWLSVLRIFAQFLRQPYACAVKELLEKARDESFEVELNLVISCMAFPFFLAKFYSFIQLFSYVCCSVKKCPRCAVCVSLK